MQLHRLTVVSACCLFSLLAAGCSNIIGDGIEELNYDSTKTSSTGGGDQTQPQTGSTSGTPLPASATGNGASMTIRKYDVSSTTISDGQSLNIHWAVESSPTPMYTAEFHLSDTLDQNKLSSATLVFSRNGGNGPLLAGSEATVACRWQVSGGATTLVCPELQAQHVAPVTPAYAILKACTYGLTETVCTQSAVQLSTPAPAAGGSATPVTTSGNGAYMTIERFDVTPASIGLGQTATVSWGLKFKTPAVAYTAEFHLSNSQQLTPGFSGLTRIFADNGSIDTTQINTDTSLTATNACTRQTDLAGTPLLNCGSRGATNITVNLTQPVYGILKACVYDLNNQLVCAEKPLPLTFP